MILTKPDFAPIYYIEVQNGRPIDTVVAAGLEWLRSQPNAHRGVLACDLSSALHDMPKSPWFRSLSKVHTRDSGTGAAGSNRPLLALFPTRDLLLKLTDLYADRVSAMCVLTYGKNDPFPNAWLDYVGAIDLVTDQKRAISTTNILDPVVEAAFVSLKGQLTAQLCTPEHSYDPNGVATLLELQRHGHELDENTLAAWAITQRFSRRDVAEFVEHIKKVKKGHRYSTKSYGSWQPNYQKWLHRIQVVPEETA